MTAAHACACDPFMGLCRAPKCDRDAVANGLCDSHRKQEERGGPLRPLRTGPALEVVSLRVSAECRAAILADPDGAKAALERWAKRRR